jgi:hypothetical protein
MNREALKLSIAGTLLTFSAALGYHLSTAKASGAPTVNPLAYGGFLENNGTPIDGVDAITINLWNDATSVAVANLVCATSSTTRVNQGYFRVPLNSTCLGAVENNADTWAEVVVGGQSLGRSKVSAAPYAIEADRASAAAGALAQQVVPSGMVAMFASGCPVGWAEYTALRGRFPRGEPSGNPASLNAGGTDDLAVVAHTHTLSGNVSAVADHQHTLSGSTNATGAHTHAFSGATDSQGAHTHRITINGAGSGTNQGYWNLNWNTVGVFGAQSATPPTLGSGLQNFMDTVSNGGHTHSFSGTTGSAGSHSHTFSTTTDLAGGHTHSLAGLSTDPTGVAGTGLNLPSFQEVIFCQKL